MNNRLELLINAAQESTGFLRSIAGSSAALKLANKIDEILDPNFEQPIKVHYVTLVELPAISFVDVFDGNVEHIGAEVIYEGAEAEYNFAHK